MEELQEMKERGKFVVIGGEKTWKNTNFSDENLHESFAITTNSQSVEPHGGLRGKAFEN